MRLHVGDRVWIGPVVLSKETEWGDYGSKLSEEWTGHFEDGMSDPIGIHGDVIPADAWLPALAAVVREVGPEVVATWLSNSATRLEFDGLSIAAGYMRRLAAALEVK